MMHNRFRSLSPPELRSEIGDSRADDPAYYRVNPGNGSTARLPLSLRLFLVLRSVRDAIAGRG